METVFEYRLELNNLDDIFHNTFSHERLQELFHQYEEFIEEIYNTIETIEDTEEHIISALEEVADDAQVQSSYIELILQR